jgi:hypothetical protein
MDIDGLSRGTTDQRDRVTKRIQRASVVTGLAALGATGVLTIALAQTGAPAAATSTTIGETTPQEVPAPDSLTSSTSSSGAPPVTTSGSS